MGVKWVVAICAVLACIPVSQGFTNGAIRFDTSLDTAGRRGNCAMKRSPMPLRMAENDPLVGDFKVGDKVKLVNDLTVYHVLAQQYPDGYVVAKGTEGEVKAIVTEKYKQSTANRPIQVAFKEPRPFVIHFEADDITKA